MRFPKLRIAWSVFWAMACVLLIVLWVDSGSRFLEVRGTIGDDFLMLESVTGEINFALIGPKFHPPTKPWKIIRAPVTDQHAAAVAKTDKDTHRGIGFGGGFHHDLWHFSVSLWLLVLVSVIFALLPWGWLLWKRFRSTGETEAIQNAATSCT